MNYTKPYWYRLILYWVKEKNKTGLTIPFILGSKKVLLNHEEDEIDSVDDLLYDIKESNIEDAIVLFYCDTIGEFVLGINNPNSPMYGNEIKNELTQRVSLILTLSTDILGNNLNDVSINLTKRYSSCLKQGKYSNVNLKWTEYLEHETQMIKVCLLK